MERIQEIQERIAKAKAHGVISSLDLEDIEYLLAENKRLREYLIQIEDESSHEDGCLTQVNGMAQEALREEGK